MDTSARGLAAIVAATASSGGGEMIIEAGPTIEEHEAALAASRADGRAEGVKAGAAAERARIQAIVSAEPARGREQLAQSLAFNTELAAEQAIAVLGDAPAAAKASRLDGLVPQPRVEAEESAADPRATAKAGLAAAVQKQVARHSRPAAR